MTPRSYHLNSCRLCGHSCGINRYLTKGVCGLGTEITANAFVIHHGEEPFISGKNGSGTVFLTGCNMSCVYCQNYQISQEGRGNVYQSQRFVKNLESLLDKGAQNLNFVSPTPYVPQIVSALKELEKLGKIPVTVYNTGGYDSPEITPFLSKHFDVFLVDMKYSSNELAYRLSAINNYVDINRQFVKNLSKERKECFIQGGILKSGIVIRHLVLPGFLDNTYGIIDYIARHLKNHVYLSLMNQYSPCYMAKSDSHYAFINRELTSDEYEKVKNYAEKKIPFLLTQTAASRKIYIPDFNRQNPFDQNL